MSALVLSASSIRAADLPKWATADDPKDFVLGFYDWYYAAMRDEPSVSPILAKRSTVAPVIKACVSQDLVKSAQRLIATDGMEGHNPFVPGNDSDDLWGAHAHIIDVRKADDLTVVEVFMRGTDPGYGHFHATDAVGLVRKDDRWFIATDNLEPPATRIHGGLFDVSPSGEYGVLYEMANARDQTATLVSLPERKPIKALIEPPPFEPSARRDKLTWQPPAKYLAPLAHPVVWNPSSTQFAVDRRFEGVRVYSISEGKLARPRSIRVDEMPIRRKLEDEIARVPFMTVRPLRWIDDTTLIVSDCAILLTTDGPLDVEYEVTMDCPPGEDPKQLKRSEASVRRADTKEFQPGRGR